MKTSLPTSEEITTQLQYMQMRDIINSIGPTFYEPEISESRDLNSSWET